MNQPFTSPSTPLGMTELLFALNLGGRGVMVSEVEPCGWLLAGPSTPLPSVGVTNRIGMAYFRPGTAKRRRRSREAN
jgi:hypothetical protein